MPPNEEPEPQAPNSESAAARPRADEPIREPELPELDLLGSDGAEVIVKALLETQGKFFNHRLAGDDERWLWTNEELEEIAPALGRYLQRIPVVREATKNREGMTAVAVLAGYALRNTVFYEPQEAPDEQTGPDRNAEPTFGPWSARVDAPPNVEGRS